MSTNIGQTMKKDIFKFQNNLYQDSWALMEELK